MRPIARAWLCILGVDLMMQRGRRGMKYAEGKLRERNHSFILFRILRFSASRYSSAVLAENLQADLAARRSSCQS